jgi:hypothetical protein
MIMTVHIRKRLKLLEHRGGFVHPDITERRGKPLADAACAGADFDNLVTGFSLGDLDDRTGGSAANRFRQARTPVKACRLTVEKFRLVVCCMHAIALEMGAHYSTPGKTGTICRCRPVRFLGDF